MKQRPSLLIVCITLVPDRSPERQDRSEQFFWQIGREEASEEQFFAQTAGPARPGPFARAERPQNDQLVALPDVLFPRPVREPDGSEQFFAPELAVLPRARLRGGWETLTLTSMPADSRHEPSPSDQVRGLWGPGNKRRSSVSRKKAWKLQQTPGLALASILHR